MEIGVDMHLYAGMSEWRSTYSLSFNINHSYIPLYTILTLYIHRNATDLQFIPVPHNAPSFTGYDDGYRSSSLPSLFKFGSLSYTTAYVISITVNVILKGFTSVFFYIQISTNGLISFGGSYTSYSSRRFPITQRVIAPYWNDQDFSSKGSIRYFSVTPTHPTHASFLDEANEYISDIEDVDFEASWMFVVRWIDACPFGNRQCTQVNYY